MNQDDVVAKRNAIYASLLKYASEAIPLRERAIDRMVLAALVDTHKDAPLKTGEIRSNLPLGATGEAVRVQLIQESLTRLEKTRRVDEVELRKKRAFYLTADGVAEVDRLVANSSDLFESAFQVTFRGIDSDLATSVARQAFRRFVCKAFELFGRDIAAVLVGHVSHNDLSGLVECESALKAAIADANVPSKHEETVRARCRSFLADSEPECVRLKFYLLQGYYLAQLFLIDVKGFSPLAEEAFKGSVFYLDTNVLFVGLLHGVDYEREFGEFIRVAKRAGAELRVTRATIEETRYSIGLRREDLEGILAKMPIELAELTKDNVLAAYFEGHERDRTLTVERFFARFDDMLTILQDQWGVVVEELTTDEILKGRDIHDLLLTLNRHAVDVRRFGKKDEVLRHDAAHYLLVQDARRSNSKVWFLTRDRTIASACAELGRGEAAVSFDFIAFVSSLSPFVATAEESNSVSDVLASVLADQTKVVEGLFEARELALMADMHADVMMTPPDQLVMAFDVAKSSVLKGEQYSREKAPEMSLALRKFLASSALERLQASRDERLRLERELQERTSQWEREEEGRRRAAAERDAAIDGKAELAGRLEHEIVVNQQGARDRRHLEALLWSIAMLPGVGLLLFPSVILPKSLLAVPARSRWIMVCVMLVALVEVGVACDKALYRVARNRRQHQLALTGTVAVLGFVAGLPDLLAVGDIVDWVTFAGVIVAIVVALQVRAPRTELPE